MIRGRNILCIASSWYEHPTSKQHVMRLLARQNHVIWVNYHASRRPTLTRRDAHAALGRLRRICTGGRRVLPGLDVISPPTIPWPESRLARAVNARLLALAIRRALRRLPPRPLQLWLFTPDVPELIPRFELEHVVYYCVDDFAAFSGFNTRLIESLEGRTLAASDTVIVTSETLFAERRPRHPHVHLVPHGVDFEHFAAAANWPADNIPADVRDIRGPVFGYFGLISDYVDLELIAATACRRPDWSFVLLGRATCPLGPIMGLPNVHVLGGRPYEELPAYCARFDVGLIPFRLNRLVRAVNPIKLREYLAAGLPIVSAPLPAVMEYVPDVFPAQTVEEFVAAGEAALRARDTQHRRARQERVRCEGWSCRVEELSRIVLGQPPVPSASPPVLELSGAGTAS